MKAHQRAGRARPGGPQWIWGENALEEAAQPLAQLPQPLLLVGEAKLVSPLRKRLSQAWIEAGVELSVAAFPEGAECSRAQAEMLAKARPGGFIALGGGKAIDSVKWAGQLAGAPVVTVPSSAATCACATAVVVEHGEGGEVLEILDVPAPRLCVADLPLLRTAPERLMQAGRADTLAKWLEWKALEEPEGEGGEAAGRAFAAAASSDDFETLLDACLRLSAMASNLGSAPAAAAHSFCAGISLFPQSREWLHGEWVALGLRLQERLKPQGAGALLDRLGLPARLPFPLTDGELLRAAGRMLAPEESIHQMPEAAALTPASLGELLRTCLA